MWNALDVAVNRVSLGLFYWAIAGLLVVGCIASNGAALAQDDQVPDPQVEGRLWNISDEDFRFRLRRSRGPTWTREHVLAPDEFYTIRRPEDGGRDDSRWDFDPAGSNWRRPSDRAVS